jgi:hypothetical protein
VGRSSAAEAERKSIRDALAAQTPKSVWDSSAHHDAIVEERMRTMTIAERTVLEISLTKRRHGGGHTYDYDALSYSAATTYDPLPIGVDDAGQDNWGRVMKPPSAPIAPRSRGWYGNQGRAMPQQQASQPQTPEVFAGAGADDKPLMT